MLLSSIPHAFSYSYCCTNVICNYYDINASYIQKKFLVGEVEAMIVENDVNFKSLALSQQDKL